MEFFGLESEFVANGNIPVQKFRSTREGSGLTVYFADVESQVINGYFCFGIDEPAATSIEPLLWHLDASGGLLPKSMRSQMVKAAWEFHGAENPLSDRDQSCYVCTALGERVFVGSFTCALFLIQNIEAVFAAHGIGKSGEEDEEARHALDAGDAEASAETERKIEEDEIYCLTEAGEGAMAWEGTLQLIFPGIKIFRNRLLDNADEQPDLFPKIWKCYEKCYQPDNLSVVITGKIQNRESIFSVLGNYEKEYYSSTFRSEAPEPFIRPWSTEVPKPTYSEETATSVAKFISRNPNREPSATICLGWRGCSSSDLETMTALKVITAHIAVGPLWDQFVSSGHCQRISWCQLEYFDCCHLVTIHGIGNDETCEKIRQESKKVIANLADESKDCLKLEELRAMAERVGWHYVRELESDPFLIIASAISKAERYGMGKKEQVEKRLNPTPSFLELAKKPIEYWRNLIQVYFVNGGTFSTMVLPKSYEKPDVPVPEVAPPLEVAAEQQFASSSRRASSRPRRRASAVALESPSLNENSTAGKMPSPVKEVPKGHLEEALKKNPYPFGDRKDELESFTLNLQPTKKFIEELIDTQTYSYFPIETYRSDEEKQHPLFPVNQLPFYTFLEDTSTSFVYGTFVLDTTHLDENMRKLIAPITAALGAILCPRPPGLDTDNEITNPTEFNPPQFIADSQVSLGINGELMQCIFITAIVLPEKYDWLVGMFHSLLYNFEFTVNFLKFVSVEAVKGLAANYRMQTASVPNYDYFDGSEINLHSLISMVYKQESNARLFVGRRRLDVINEFLKTLDNDPEGTVSIVTETWRKIVEDGKIVVQIAGNVKELAAGGKDLTQSWKKYFNGIQKSLKFEEAKPRLEPELMRTPGQEGVAVTTNHPRPSCLTTAIVINPNDEDFPKVCIAAQLVSMAQKWIWACLDEEDSPMPILRMPCSYSNIMTLTLESQDVIGAMEAMKRIVNEDWEWLDPILVATKHMVINDPASVDQGPQGTIVTSLLAHLCGMSTSTRRNLVLESLKATTEDIKQVIRTYLKKLFDPKHCWYSLMTYTENQENVIQRLQEFGFSFQKRNLQEICTQL